jgi:hypothetical protein
MLSERRHRCRARWAAQAAPPLGVALFWCGIWIAVRRYPREYDWRYMTLSSLLSSVRDPAGHLWASAGVVACGLCGFCWAAWWLRQSATGGAGAGRSAFRVLPLGYLCMALAAALPGRLLPFPKGHEMLAILAFAGVCYGMIGAYRLCFFRPDRAATGRRRWYASALLAAAVSPLVLASFAQAYVFFELPDLPWVNLSWRARGVPVYLSFAFWEWLTCAVLSAYMAVLCLARPGGRQPESLGRLSAAGR